MNKSILKEKIVKLGNKWQVQSEKGKNLGTYDTKDKAEKRLQQVHYFKHINEAVASEKKAINILRKNNLLTKDYVDKPTYILSTGEFIDANNPIIKNLRNGTVACHTMICKLFGYENYVDGSLKPVLDFNWIRYNPFNRYHYIELPDNKPTEAQLNSIGITCEHMLSHGPIKLYIYDPKYSKNEYKILEFDDSDSLLKAINKHYSKHINEDLNNKIVYHGTDTPNITKFDHEQNWFSPSWDYANYYALSLNDKGYIYKCNISLGKNLNIGKTGYPVYNPLRPIQPYALTKEIKNIFKNLGIEDEKEIRNILDDVQREFGLKYNGYQMRLSTVIRSKAFIELLKSKHYDSVTAIEYCVPTSEYVTTYGIINPSLIKIISKEQVNFNESLSNNQKDYFANTKAVDSNGKPLVLYHGTTVPNINKFRTKNSYGKSGIFFSNSKELADSYTYGDGEVYACYLSIDNPIIIDAENNPYNAIPYNDDLYTTFELAEKFKDKCDGLIIKNVLEHGKYIVDDYIVYKPEQIKKIDNTNPTSSQNINEEVLESNVLYTNSPYKVKNKLLASKRPMRVFIDNYNETKDDIYLVGDADTVTHSIMLDKLRHTGVDIFWNDDNYNQIAIVYVPNNSNDMFDIYDAVDDAYDTMYVYNNFTIYSRYTDFRLFSLYNILGKPIDIVDIDEDFLKHIKRDWE